MHKYSPMHEIEVAYTQTLAVDTAVRCIMYKPMHGHELVYTKKLVVDTAV